MRKIDIISNLLQLIFPRVCHVCGEKLLDGESIVCIDCLLELPYTYDWLSDDNHLRRLLSEEFDVEWAASYIFYSAGSDYSKLIKNIKFRNQFRSAEKLGVWYATLLKDNVLLPKIDYIIPVPLHTKRYLWRGYNQSYHIAKGFSHVANTPIKNKIVRRIFNNAPQVSQANYMRRENIEGVFKVTDHKQLDNKSVLIIDDVCTTGSTLLEIIKCIKESAPNCKVSVATLARTKGDGVLNIGGRNIL